MSSAGAANVQKFDMCSKHVRPPQRRGSETSRWEASRKDDADVIEQRAPERVTASHCESPDKRNGMVDARTTTQQLQVLDEYKGHAHNAENLIITDVLKAIVRAP